VVWAKSCGPYNRLGLTACEVHLEWWFILDPRRFVAVRIGKSSDVRQWGFRASRLAHWSNPRSEGRAE